MPISVTCESCWMTFDVSDAHAGKRGKCPECGSVVEVPRSAPPRTRLAGGAPPRTAERRKAPQRSRPSASSSGSRKTLWIGLGASGAVALLALVALVAFNLGGSHDDAPARPDTPQITAAAPTSPPAAAGHGASSSPALMPNPSAAMHGATPNGLSASPTAMRDLASANTASPQPNLPPAANGTLPAAGSAPSAASAAPPPRRSLTELIETIEPSVVRIDVQDAEGGSTGSGFVVASDGIIATNYHVIAGATSATVVFPDQGSAAVVGHVALDPKRDIALLKIEYPSEKLKPLKLATSLPRKGESVVAFGSPLGLSFSASEGIIAALRTPQEIAEFGTDVEGQWIQTTTPISPGNSGGPLVNHQGEVVAINTAVIGGGVAQNVNFAISSVDLGETLAKKTSAAVVKLSPESAPKVAGTPDREKAVDLTGTERGAKLLAEIESVQLVVARFSFDPTGAIGQIVLSEARDAIERAGIEEAFGIERNPALCLVTLELAPTSGAAGAQEMTLSMIVLCRTTEKGRQQVAQVWKERERVGTFSVQSLYRGVVPRNAQSKMSAFFRKFISAVRKADREQQAAAAGESDSGDSQDDDAGGEAKREE